MSSFSKFRISPLVWKPLSKLVEPPEVGPKSGHPYNKNVKKIADGIFIVFAPVANGVRFHGNLAQNRQFMIILSGG